MKKREAKIINMFVKGTKIYLKKKKKKSVNIIANIKNLPEDKKQRIVEYRINYYIT